MTLYRSSTCSGSQLGFNVSRESVVTDIEPVSPAGIAGLTAFSRLVRVNGFDVVAMTYEQLLDVLRSSPASVVLTVIPPPPQRRDRNDTRSLHLTCLSFMSSLPVGGARGLGHILNASLDDLRKIS